MAITLTIAGVDKTSLLVRGSLSWSDNLNARNTCSFELVSTDGSYRPAVGAIVVIANGATKVFAGSIDSYEEEKGEGNSSLWYSVDCVDYNQLLDRHLVAQAYDGDTLGDIVADILANFLAGEGVTATQVQTGPTITRAVFNYVSATAAFDELADASGFAWWIDYDKGLHFCDRTANAAPFSLTDSSANFRALKVRRTREQYRNKQYIRGGQALTASRSETLTGDGKTRVFPVAYPVGTTPTITLGGASKTVGIRGVDTGKDFYWNKGEREITQDDAGTLLTSASNLVIGYQGLYPILLAASDDSAVASMAASEGGTGVYEVITSAPEVDSDTMATEKANGLLRKYGRVPRYIEFETDSDGLFAGQLLPVTLTAHALSGSYFIESVSGKDVDGRSLRYQVRALDGEALGGWETFFKAMAASGQQFTVRDNEVVILLRRLSETITVTESVSYIAAAPESRVDFALVDSSEVA